MLPPPPTCHLGAAPIGVVLISNEQHIRHLQVAVGDVARVEVCHAHSNVTSTQQACRLQCTRSTNVLKSQEMLR